MAWACDQVVRSEPQEGGGRFWLHPLGRALVDISEDAWVKVSYLSGEKFGLALESHGVPLDVRKRLQAEDGQGFPGNVEADQESIFALLCSHATWLYLFPENDDARRGILSDLKAAGVIAEISKE